MSNFKEICLNSTITNPYTILLDLMHQPEIPMHGPVHHILDGAALMTAIHNTGTPFNLKTALDELEVRGLLMPGGTCGKWGICGSASSVGAALAIINGTGPLTNSEYYNDNLKLTSRVLSKIAELGGPRCCKRNAFTALNISVDFVQERYGILLEKQKIECNFSNQNRECIKELCPYHKLSL